MKFIGKILWWDARDQEGIIVDADGNEYYFNRSTFPEHTKLKAIEGRFVQFQINRNVTHVLCASNISVIPPKSQVKAQKSFEKGNKRNLEIAA